MRKSRRNLLLFLFVFLFTLLACSTVSNSEAELTNKLDAISNSLENTSEDQDPIPSEISQPSGPVSLDLDVDKLLIIESNFSSDFVYTFSGEESPGNPITGGIHLFGKTTVDPEVGSDYEISLEGLAIVDGANYLHFVSTSENDFAYLPETGCLSFSRGEFEDQIDFFADPDEMLQGTLQRVEKNVLINGIMTDKYKINDVNVDFNDMESGDTFDLEEGSLWLSHEGFIVRLLLEGTGTSETLTGLPDLVGDIVYDFNFTPISEPILLSPPKECNLGESGEIESPFPMTDDASNINTMSDQFLSYNTSYEMNDLLDFLNSEMTTRGFTLDSEIIYETVITLRFTKGDEVVSILALKDETGIYIVTIVKEN